MYLYKSNACIIKYLYAYYTLILADLWADPGIKAPV